MKRVFSSRFGSYGRTLLTSLLLVLMAGCASDPDRPEDIGEKALYEQALDYLDDSNYDLAVRTLQLLEARYPFGPYAEQAQLEIIYAHFQSYDIDEAVASADRFIRLHPQHPNVDYAYYMKGLANFSQGRGLLSRFLPTDFTQRDPGPAERSFADFTELLSRYPDSSYAADAQARMVYLRNWLARYEINVANYYFKRGAYLAAANRGRYVVENFQQTPAVPDGLAVMVQAYLLLEMPELAENARQVLALNYPSYPLLDAQGQFRNQFDLSEEGRSWLNQLSLGLLDHPEPPRFDTRPEGSL